MSNEAKRKARAKRKAKQLNIINNNVAPEKKMGYLQAMDDARHKKAGKQ